MGDYKRIIFLALIMATATTVVLGVTFSLLYNTAFEEQRSHLTNMAQSTARMIEAGAIFDQKHIADYPDGAVAATIAQIKRSHQEFKGIGETGEFTLARREGDQIVFILRHRHHDLDTPHAISLDGSEGEPMQLALSGLSGTIIGLDYRGETVLAAFEPVAVLNLGIVAKIDLAEIRAPFVKVGGVVIGLALLVITTGTVLFFRIGEPLIRALHTNRERYEAIVQGHPEMISRFLPDGTITFLNDASCRFFGKSREEMVGQTFAPLVVQEDVEEIKGKLKALSKDDPVKIITNRVIAADGKIRWVRWANQAICDDKGRIIEYQSGGHDITEQMQAHEEVKQANIAKTKFLAAASHDLRQPLQALNMFLGVLGQREHDDKSRTILNKIYNSVEALEALLDGLLDISRLEAGQIVPDIHGVALSRLLDRLADEFEQAAEDKGLTFRAVSTSVQVVSDGVLLEDILRNLLTNAIKYTDEGKILLGCRRRGKNLRLEVWDTGLGIPDDQLELIFQEFHQIGNNARARSQGLGLGLSIVTRTAELLGHRIEVSSTLGKGSVFSLELPMAEMASAVPETEPPPVDMAAPTAFIVVVDDDLDILDATKMQLEDWGHSVLTVPCVNVLASDGCGDCNGCDELYAPETTTPDLIIADYSLRGGITGDEAIGILRRHFDAEIPAIILTGDTAPERIAEIQSSGFPLLHKPIHPERLQEQIWKLIA